MSDRLYVLDFDGVICDSRLECMITSYNAYNAMHSPCPPRCFNADPIPDAQRKQFLEYRFLVRVAREYYLLWEMILRRQSISKSAPIGEQICVEPAELERFKAVFFQERYEWMTQDVRSWLGNNPLYDGIVYKLQAWCSDQRLWIVSAKDSRSILTILAHNSVSIPESFVLGNERGDKGDIMRPFCSTKKNARVAFIDDNLDNVRLVKGLGVKSYLASWGYNYEETVRNALLNGIDVLTLDEFTRLD